MDFVTILTDTGEDVDFALEIVNAGYLHVTLLGPMLTDVTQEEVRGLVPILHPPPPPSTLLTLIYASYHLDKTYEVDF